MDESQPKPIGKLLSFPDLRSTSPLDGPPPLKIPWICPNCKTEWASHYEGIDFVGEDTQSFCKKCATAARSKLVAHQILREKLLNFGLSEDRFQAMTFEAYQPVTQEQINALARAKTLAERWKNDGLKGRNSIFFWAPANPLKGKADPARQGYGCGKTHLAVALLQHAVDLGFSVAVEGMSQFLEDVKESYNAKTGGESDVIDRVREAQVALLDDVGTEYVKEGSETWYRDIIYKIVDHAYSHSHALIVTSNLEPPALLARIGERAASRFMGLIEAPIKILGPDHRLLPF